MSKISNTGFTSKTVNGRSNERIPQENVDIIKKEFISLKYQFYEVILRIGFLHCIVVK